MTISIVATFLVLFFAGCCLAVLLVSRIALYAALHMIGGTFSKNNVDLSRMIIHVLIFVVIAIFEVVSLKNYTCAL